MPPFVSLQPEIPSRCQLLGREFDNRQAEMVWIYLMLQFNRYVWRHD